MRTADPLPDPEYDQHAEEAQQEAPSSGSSQPFGAEGQYRHRQYDQRRGGVPDPGEHGLDPLLAVAEQGERERHAERTGHDQMGPYPRLTGQSDAQHGKQDQQRQRAGTDPVEGELQRVQLTHPDLDEQEAGPPDRGQREKPGQPAP
ncbi:hypothetical protein Sar04_09710 [Salinispora arenicola]|uniref:Uncharacterized protein n=1 Tax=Salinispora arenicola TaxID=168697 RepID=A0ABQ4JMM7_SALAC|nr:hypothetical protein Sar04_09710 [Salinispora arenicola]